MLSCPSFSSVFVFSINSLILSGFPLTFHLTEASLSAFSWLFTLECAVIQQYHKMSSNIVQVNEQNQNKIMNMKNSVCAFTIIVNIYVIYEI